MWMSLSSAHGYSMVTIGCHASRESVSCVTPFRCNTNYQHAPITDVLHGFIRLCIRVVIRGVSPQHEDHNIIGALASEVVYRIK